LICPATESEIMSLQQLDAVDDAILDEVNG
jgi:hypothetical protein